MAITADQITAATYTEDGDTLNSFKTGTFTTAPAAGDTTVTLTPTSASHNIGARDVGRYLYLPASRNKIRITGRAGNDVTLERPIDVSDYRATLDSQGNAFSEDVPSDGDSYTISMELDDLVDIDNTTISFSGSTYTLEGSETVRFPNGFCLAEPGVGTFYGALPTGFFNTQDNTSTQIMFAFGRVHPNWTSGETTAPEHYNSGGWSIILTGASPSGLSIGASVQLINTIYRNSAGGVSFVRFYSDDADGNNLRVIAENTVFTGRLGGRIEGNKSFVKNCRHIGSSYFGFNLRSTSTGFFGLFTDFTSIDCQQSVYFYPEFAGTTTVYDGLKVINPRVAEGNEFIFINNSNAGKSNKILRIVNADIDEIIAITTANEDWLVQANSDTTPSGYTNSFTRWEQTLTSSATDVDSAAFTEDAKLFIYTDATSGDDITYTPTFDSTDGTWASTDIRIREYNLGTHGWRFSDDPDANDIEYVSDDPNRTAKLSARAYGYNTATAVSSLYGPTNSFAPIFLVDNDIAETTKATVDAYTTLETSAKLYDFSRSLIFDNPQGVSTDGQSEMFTKSGDTIVSDFDITFQTGDITGGLSAELDYDLTDGVTVKATTPFTNDIEADGQTVTFVKPAAADAFINAGVDTGSSGTIVLSGHATGDLIIDTIGKVVGTIELTTGTYTIDGGADVSELTINAASGDTVVIAIADAVTSVGSNDLTLGTGVSSQKVVTVTMQLDEAYDDDKLKKFRWTGATSAADYTSSTKKDHNDSDVDITQDDNAFTANFAFTIANTDNVYLYVAYEGYEHAIVAGDDVSEITITPIPLSTAQIDFTEVAADGSDDETLEGLTPTVGSDTSGTAFAAADDDVHFLIPTTASLASSTLPVTGNFDKKFVWRAMHTNNWADGVLGGFVDLNPWKFLPSAIQLNYVSLSTEEGRYLQNFSKSSNANIIQLASRIINASEFDLRTTISTTSSLTEVRFGINASGATYVEVQNAASAAIAADVSPKLTNIGLSVPVLNAAGDAFDTTPNLPS